MSDQRKFLPMRIMPRPNLRAKEFTVLVGKEAAQDDQNFAYLGAAALGALIAAILAKAK